MSWKLKRGAGLTLITLLVVTFGWMGLAEGEQADSTSPAPAAPGTVRIMLWKDKAGEDETIIVDANGRFEPMTLGRLIAYALEAILGRSLQDCPVTQTESVTFGLEWNESHELTTYVVDTHEKKEPFDWATFLTPLALSFTECKQRPEGLPAVGQTHIFFERVEGRFQPMILDATGYKEILNLGSLISIVAHNVPECSPDFTGERVMQIVFDWANKADVKIYLLDAYFKRQYVTMDNLVRSAAETLGQCQKGNTVGEVPISQTLPYSIPIRFEEGAHGGVKAYLTSKSKKAVPLDLGSLMTAAAALAPYGVGGRSAFLEISFNKDQEGTIHPQLTDLYGKNLPLNLANLLRSACSFQAQGQPRVDK